MKYFITLLIVFFPAFLFSQKKSDTTYQIVVYNSSNEVVKTINNNAHFKIKMLNGEVFKGKINFMNDSQFMVNNESNKIGLIKDIDFIKQIKTGKRITGMALLSASAIMAIKGVFFSDKSNGLVTEEVADYTVSGFFATASIPFFINKKYSTSNYKFKVQRLITQSMN